MAAVTLSDLDRTESLLLLAAELLDDTPSLDNDDVCTVRAKAIADRMRGLGEEISASLWFTSAKRAETLARTLANAHRYISWACVSLEAEYGEWRRVPRKPCLMWHACRVLRVLECARAMPLKHELGDALRADPEVLGPRVRETT